MTISLLTLKYEDCKTEIVLTKNLILSHRNTDMLWSISLKKGNTAERHTFVVFPT